MFTLGSPPFDNDVKQIKIYYNIILIIGDYKDTHFVQKNNNYEMLWTSLVAAMEADGALCIISWANF